jgi:hypothetical protein
LKEFPHGDSSGETSQISTDFEVRLDTADVPWAVAEAPPEECSTEEVVEAPPEEGPAEGYIYD